MSCSGSDGRLFRVRRPQKRIVSSRCRRRLLGNPVRCLASRKRRHGLAYPSFTTTYCRELYRRMCKGKVQQAWVHVVRWCEVRMVRRGYCLLSKFFLPTCASNDMRYCFVFLFFCIQAFSILPCETEVLNCVSHIFLIISFQLKNQTPLCNSNLF